MEDYHKAIEYKQLLEDVACGRINYKNNKEIGKSFMELRRELVSNTLIQNEIPRFVKFCRTVEDFWGFIKNEASSYEERRMFLKVELTPLLDSLEFSTENPVRTKNVTQAEDSPAEGSASHGQVFLCHSSDDKPFVDQLAENLKEEGYQIWLDSEQIHVGEDFTEKIEQGISKSEFVAVVLSNNFTSKGPWANEEYRLALVRQVKERRVILLPLLLEDCKIPSQLERRNYADFRKKFDDGFSQLTDSINHYLSSRK